jgi:rare lipoprotein A
MEARDFCCKQPLVMDRRILARPLAALLLAAFAAFPGGASRAASIEPELPLTEPGAPVLTAPAPTPAAEQLEQPAPLAEGLASYYGRSLAGRRTASGEVFNPGELTAAHRTLPFGTRLKVTDITSGRSVVVRVNDRGPFTHGRLIDVSEAAARELGMIARGSGRVSISLADAATPAP